MKEQHKITLKIPSYDDYAHFYNARFTEQVVYWADDFPHKITLDDYACGRLLAQSTEQIFERIIVLDGEPIGTITARDFVRKICQCTLGVVIAIPKYWGHGYGYEAIRQFITILSLEGFTFIVLETYANNKRAQRCFTKLGFQKRRVFFAPQSGRFVVQMACRVHPPEPIGERIAANDPRWKPPHRT